VPACLPALVPCAACYCQHRRCQRTGAARPLALKP
jgi:hypothetical protein